MKRWMIRILMVSVLITIASCADHSPSVISQTVPEASVTTSPQFPQTKPAVVEISQANKIDPDQLVKHIQHLNFERYSASNRARTRDYLTQTLTDYGWQPQLQTFEGGVNLVAVRPGTNTNAGTILVTAHYDTVSGSPGADDNASGVATALEIARLLGQQKTVRSLQIAFFDQEEQGLLGSLAFVSKPANLKQLSGVINLEMVGYACYTTGCQKYPEGLPLELPSNQGDFLGVVGDQEHLPLLNAFQLNEKLSLPAVVTLPVPFKGVATPDLLRSDHAPFWYQNIGAVMVTDTANFRNPNYHRQSDTPDTLDLTFLAGSAQRVLNAVYYLLNNPKSLTSINPS